jgi:hypothetical protein
MRRLPSRVSVRTSPLPGGLSLLSATRTRSRLPAPAISPLAAAAATVSQNAACIILPPSPSNKGCQVGQTKWPCSNTVIHVYRSPSSSARRFRGGRAPPIASPSASSLSEIHCNAAPSGELTGRLDGRQRRGLLAPAPRSQPHWPAHPTPTSVVRKTSEPDEPLQCLCVVRPTSEFVDGCISSSTARPG